MDMDVPGGANQTISAEVDLGVRSSEVSLPARCSICFSVPRTTLFTLREPGAAPQPQQSWTLCKACYAAVRRELQRSPLHSPARVRVAVGLVAAERWPHLQQHVAEREERLWIMFLLCGFAGCVLVNLLVMILIARL